MAPATMLAAALALCLLQAGPALAWYKPVAGSGHYSVGRAAGLLSGLRGAPFARRAEPPGTLPAQPHPQRLAVCAQDIAQNLRSCEKLPDSLGTFQCKADVFVSLRPDCRGP